MGFGRTYGREYGIDSQDSYSYAFVPSDTITVADAVSYEIMRYKKDTAIAVSDIAGRGATFERYVDDWRRTSRP